MHVLPLYNTDNVDRLTWPDGGGEVTLHSSALSIFTDFKKHMPLVIDGNTKAIELERLMKRSHVKMKIVLDQVQQFIGIVTLADLNEQRILQKVAQGSSREELVATDFMQPKASLRSFDYHELAHASVGDIVETLKGSGQQHCLVVERQSHEIRGIVSVSDLARILRLPLDIQSHPSFAALSKIVAA